MSIALLDVDGHNFPNIPLMKLSAYHKNKGDSVEWYVDGMCYDVLYMSKVFTFSRDYDFGMYEPKAKKIIRGGTGYNSKVVLPDEIEHIYPDYSIYFDKITEIKNTAYGFLTRGCPRGCDFCIVQEKEGATSHKVANLSEFWRGQKNIVLLDPNFFACKDWRELSVQLIKSGAWVDFSQGLDARIMTQEKISALKSMKIKRVHFAWDRYRDKDKILSKFLIIKKTTGWGYQKLNVFVLCNFDTTIEQDLERVYTLRDMGFNPYVMLYEKEKLPRGSVYKKLQRWCNNRMIFRSVKSFKEYKTC